ncbi:hypothetical protein I552_2289 [Mycobacterium xenopi 3993]|nr:hypothetical protein I552_2289 [Mycobacterium xenopi 3993]
MRHGGIHTRCLRGVCAVSIVKERIAVHSGSRYRLRVRGPPPVRSDRDSQSRRAVT